MAHEDARPLQLRLCSSNAKLDLGIAKGANMKFQKKKKKKPAASSKTSSFLGIAFRQSTGVRRFDIVVIAAKRKIKSSAIKRACERVARTLTISAGRAKRRAGEV